MDIIYEDQEILLAYKEAGLPTETKRLGQMDLVSQIKNHLSQKCGKANPFVGLINRLDQPVEGLVLFGKSREATAALNKSLQNYQIEKYYYALVYGKRAEERERIEQYLIQNRKLNQSFVAEKGDSEAKKAILSLTIMKEIDGCELLNIHLETGRHHQIRVQLSSTGTPILGDSKYGSEESKAYSMEQNIKTVALCAYKLILQHPKTKKEMEFCIKPKHPAMGVYFHEK